MMMEKSEIKKAIIDVKLNDAPMKKQCVKFPSNSSCLFSSCFYGQIFHL